MHAASVAPGFGASPAELMRQLRRAERGRQARALLLVAPLAAFLLLSFVLPIALLLWRAVDNPEVVSVLPRTAAALRGWDRQGLPPDTAFASLAADLTIAKAEDSAGAAARRLNAEVPGLRSLVMKTVRAMPLGAAGEATPAPPELKRQFLALDARWGEPATWQAIARNARGTTWAYLLAAVDLREDGQGAVRRVPPEEAVYLDVLLRTFWMSLVVTVVCLALGYPLAYWLSTLSARRANLFMILVLIPFWTSVLVRIAAWIVLLQTEGVVNRALTGAGIIEAPLPLLFNRLGVYVAMTHILLPFMVLPLYSVMKGIPKTYLRAAISLGSHPFAAFWRVVAPQTVPGVAAGSLLVFILALGYYITPALLGGPSEQMVSYYVAYYTNVTINWGMAAALSVVLLAATLGFYAVYRRLAKADVSMGG